MSKFCKVNGCRFYWTHSTFGHKCGNCNNYGHGRTECGNPQKIKKLTIFSSGELPLDLQCTIKNCKFRNYHITSAHVCDSCHLFQKECKCRMEDSYVKYITKFDDLHDDIKLFANSKLNNINSNSYVIFQMDLGCSMIIRKNIYDSKIEGFFMHSDDWGQYGTTHLSRYNQFIEGYLHVK